MDLAAARARGQDVILVSSGAIALGRGCLGLSDAPLSLEQSQAAAAAGQISLAHAWQEALTPQGMTIAQILLTLEDTEQRRRYLNARSIYGNTEAIRITLLLSLKSVMTVHGGLKNGQ